MGLNLLEKTELWINEITLDHTNLTDLANAVARSLGLSDGEVLVVDVRPRHITLDVLATPRMIALVEETAWKSIAEHLEPGMGSVGIRVDIRHLAATPVGMKVWCETVVSEVEGRKLSFHAAVYDEAGKIGEGAHERFLVDEVKFQEKAELKARNA